MKDIQPIPYKITELPPPRFKDRTGINWGKYNEKVEATDSIKTLRLLTLDSGLIIPVYVNSSTQNIQPLTLGWFNKGEDFDLSNGWHLDNYSASYGSDNTFGVMSMLSRDKTVGKTKHNASYLVDFVDHDLRFTYEAEDDENKFRISIGSQKQEDSLVLETILSSKSKVTGYEFNFHFDSNGTMVAITFGKKPLKGSVIVLDKLDEPEKQGKSLGEEVGMSLHEEEVDLHDVARVNEICKTYLGVTPNIDMKLKLDNIATLKGGIDNINKTENEMQINLRSFIAFDRSTIKQDVRAFG